MHTLFYEDLSGDMKFREQSKPQLPGEMSKEGSTKCWVTRVGWDTALLERT